MRRDACRCPPQADVMSESACRRRARARAARRRGDDDDDEGLAVSAPDPPSSSSPKSPRNTTKISECTFPCFSTRWWRRSRGRGSQTFLSVGTPDQQVAGGGRAMGVVERRDHSPRGRRRAQSPGSRTATARAIPSRPADLGGPHAALANADGQGGWHGEAGRWGRAARPAGGGGGRRRRSRRRRFVRPRTGARRPLRAARKAPSGPAPDARARARARGGRSSRSPRTRASTSSCRTVEPSGPGPGGDDRGSRSRRRGRGARFSADADDLDDIMRLDEYIAQSALPALFVSRAPLARVRPAEIRRRTPRTGDAARAGRAADRSSSRPPPSRSECPAAARCGGRLCAAPERERERGRRRHARRGAVDRGVRRRSAGESRRGRASTAAARAERSAGAPGRLEVQARDFRAARRSRAAARARRSRSPPYARRRARDVRHRRSRGRRERRDGRRLDDGAVSARPPRRRGGEGEAARASAADAAAAVDAPRAPEPSAALARAARPRAAQLRARARARPPQLVGLLREEAAQPRRGAAAAALARLARQDRRRGVARRVAPNALALLLAGLLPVVIAAAAGRRGYIAHAVRVVRDAAGGGVGGAGTIGGPDGSTSIGQAAAFPAAAPRRTPGSASTPLFAAGPTSRALDPTRTRKNAHGGTPGGSP